MDPQEESGTGSGLFLDQRRALVVRDPVLTGLDRIGVVRLDDLTWRLDLHFLTGPEKLAPVPLELARRNLQLVSASGVKLRQPSIVGISLPLATSTQAPTHVVEVMVRFRNLQQAQQAVAAGPARLELLGLTEVDSFFSAASFSFAAEPLASEVSEASAERFVEGSSSLGRVDTMARDYESFRTLMLNHMATRVPDWAERNPADLGVTLIEALAYAGDYLSYFQDGVATEAYLQTARLRPSIRRLARLIDYYLDEGCNARVWVQLEIEGEGPLLLPRGSQLLTQTGERGAVLTSGSWAEDEALGSGTVVFETLFEERLDPSRGSFEIYTWGASELTLPAGSCSLALVGHHPWLVAGDVLLVAPTEAGRAASGGGGQVIRLEGAGELGVDPATGSAYTRLRWFAGDALVAPLPVVTGGGLAQEKGLAAVYGNLVLADHGRTVLELLPQVPLGDALRMASYNPELGRVGLTFRALFDPSRMRKKPATAALLQNPWAVLPAVTLVETNELCKHPGEGAAALGKSWQPRFDLLQSDRFSSTFVVEMTEERRARLRFGDGSFGRRPPPGARFQAYYRIGSGPSGNVAAGSIAHLATADPELQLRVLSVSNPVPGTGGRSWERLEKARLSAPTAFHTQRRCVTREDFETAAETHPQVVAAAARLRWSGRWNTAFVYLQRRAGQALDPTFLDEMEALLRPLLVADTGLSLRPPEWVALGLAFTISYQPQFDAQVVRRQLEDTLSDRQLPNGTTGFFYPDNLRFGERIYASDLIARLSAVDGVVGVVVDRFERLDRSQDGSRSKALARGYLEIGALEIALLANRPASPELGTLDFVLEPRR